LMRAGLAPRLTTPGVVPGVDHWRIAVMRPGDGATPFDALANALQFDPGEYDEAGFGKALPELQELLARTGESFAQVLAADADRATPLVGSALGWAAAAHASAEGYGRELRSDLLLLVDQLEDVFSAHVTLETRGAFASRLAALSGTRRIWVVATLRSDLYEQLINERPWIALKDAGVTYDLVPPSPEEIEEIVRRSAPGRSTRHGLWQRSGTRAEPRCSAD